MATNTLCFTTMLTLIEHTVELITLINNATHSCESLNQGVPIHTVL